MNKLSRERRTQIVGCLVEGMSIRATSRLTGAAKGTIIKLLEDLGTACLEYQRKTLVNLPCKKLQADEVWQFCYAKERNVPKDKRGKFGFGNVWTWTVIDADTKLIPTWFVGNRDAGSAYELMLDLESRLTSRVQLTTDGHRAYISAVAGAFGTTGIDYAMLVKQYGPDMNENAAHRYSPPICTGIDKTRVFGDPDVEHVSTSFVERQNLSMRMHMRRFTRLTNAFSKKLENMCHMLALYFMFYNFARVHQTLRVTPAMEAKVSNHVWTIEEIVDLVPEEEIVILK